MTAAPAACTRSPSPQADDVWLGAKVCSHPALRGVAVFGLGHIVAVSGGHATVQYRNDSGDGSRRTWRLSDPELVIMGPGEALAQRLADQNVSCWPMANGDHLSTPVARSLFMVQRQMDRVVYEGAWNTKGDKGLKGWRSPYVPPWNSTRDSGLFHGQSIVLLGASPTRQLAVHLPAQLAGMFDGGPIVEPHKAYTSCEGPFGSSNHYSSIYLNRVKPLAGTTICSMLPCEASPNTSLSEIAGGTHLRSRGHGCPHCYCCCGCRQCSTADFTLRANASGVETVVHFSDKPELGSMQDDRAAMTSRFCRDPPAMLIWQKGIHDAYFDVFTVPAWQLPLVQNRSIRQKEAIRVTAEEHVARIEPLLREYVNSMFSCLPDSTLIVMVTPLHSFKAPWEAPLVQATYGLMVNLLDEGVLSRNRILFIDAHYMSLCTNIQSKDGNHYDTPMQTALWTVLAHAYRLWTDTLSGVETGSNPVA
jgi:hypothetical protein